ncbi:hypothetical protein Hamer_G007911, partial [Homarus americanus]
VAFVSLTASRLTLLRSGPDVSAMVIDGAAFAQMIKPSKRRPSKSIAKQFFSLIQYYMMAWKSEMTGCGFGCLSAGREVIIVTDGEDVLCVHDCVDLSRFTLCSHKEADTRIILHYIDAASKGHNRILAVEELWITFGSGNNFRYLPIHLYASAMGQEKAGALPMFHATKGCDAVSFCGRGKKTAWDIWRSCEQATHMFLLLTASPGAIIDEQLAVLERFIVLLYGRNSEIKKVNDALKYLYTNKGRGLKGFHQPKLR